jgi:hypothetical protein
MQQRRLRIREGMNIFNIITQVVVRKKKNTAQNVEIGTPDKEPNQRAEARRVSHADQL